ncbi:MAG: hypothetical protein WCJ97_07085 [Phycisphaerae bacterium]
MVHFQCPHCQKSLHYPPRWVGHYLLCEFCTKTIRVPMPYGTPEAASDAEPATQTLDNEAIVGLVHSRLLNLSLNLAS